MSQIKYSIRILTRQYQLASTIICDDYVVTNIIELLAKQVRANFMLAQNNIRNDNLFATTCRGKYLFLCDDMSLNISDNFSSLKT